MITEENIDEYLLLHTDGELSPAQEQALLTYLEAYPGYKSDLAAYKAAKLQPEFIAYPGKKALIKKETTVKIAIFRGWKGYSMAAGIAALLVMTFLYRHRDNSEAAVNKTTERPAFRHDVPAADAAMAGQKPTVDSIGKLNTLSRSENKATKRAAAEQGKIATAITKQKPAHATKQHIPAKENELPAVRHLTLEREQIALLDVARAITLPSPVEERENTTVGFVLVAHEANSESLLDKLPIDDTKKEGMEVLAENIGDQFRQVSALKKKLDEKNVSVRLQKRKLIISF